jgi:hypothetical protein
LVARADEVIDLSDDSSVVGGTNQTWQLRLAMSAHRGTSGNPHGGRASRAAYAILDDIDMDQCTNEWLLEPETSGNVDPQKSLWSEDHAHL